MFYDFNETVDILDVSASILIVLSILLVSYGRHRHNYWASRGIWSPKCYWILGHKAFLDWMTLRWEYIEKIYRENRERKYWGMYLKFSPMIVICDPDMIQLILRTKSYSFDEIPNFEHSEALTVLKEIFNNKGKMKVNFKGISESVENLVQNCTLKMNKDRFVQMKSMAESCTMDVLGNCIYGIKSNWYSDEQSKFVKSCYGLTKVYKLNLTQVWFHNLYSKLYGDTSHPAAVKSLKYIQNKTIDIMKYRLRNRLRKRDFLDHLLQNIIYKDADDLESKYRVGTLLGACLLFQAYGFHSTSSTLAFATYLLAKNKSCQENLRNELKELISSEEEPNYYQLVMKAPYLDACLSETLRMYCPNHFIERRCTLEYDVPDDVLTITKDMIVMIPIWSLHYDERYWTEPSRFNPDRFLPQNKHLIKDCTYFGFGIGPRRCGGDKFASMAVKMALVRLVLNFEISLKPEFKLKMTGYPVLKPDDNGIPLILESLSVDYVSDFKENEDSIEDSIELIRPT